MLDFIIDSFSQMTVKVVINKLYKVLSREIFKQAIFIKHIVA